MPICRRLPIVRGALGTGMVPLDSVRDTPGPMARTVADMAILLDVIAGPDPEDAATARAAGHLPPAYVTGLKRDSLKGARLGVLRQVFTPALADPRIIDISYNDFKQQSPPDLAPSRAGAENILAQFPGGSSQVGDYVDTSILDNLKTTGFFGEMQRKYGKR